MNQRLLVLLTALFLALLAGCSTWRTGGDSLLTPALEPVFSDTSLVADTLESAADRAEVMLTDARAALISGDYALAHRMMLSAIYELDTTYADSADPARTKIIEQMVAIYSDSLPSAYNDSVPTEISMLVFERQLAHALDSLEIEPDDSLSRIFIACQKQTTYDVPVDYNERTLLALEFFVTRRKETINRWFERIPYYYPVMKQMFVERGLPADLAYLPLIESGFNPKAYSFAHASGIWQFIYGTGIRYGLRRTYWVDERRDPLKSTIAAAGYLGDLYAEFNDWYLSLASYNCGEGRIRRELLKSDTATYWTMKLPTETMLYVPKYLASLIIARNPSCFGIVPPAPDSITLGDLDTVYVSKCYNLATIESGLGLSAGKLKAINPHILQWCTPPDIDNVLLYLPPGKRALFDSIVTTLPLEETVRWYRYRVRSGDNLGAIARKFGLPIAAIAQANKLKNNRIYAGHYLLIPLPSGSGTAAQSAKSLAHLDRSTEQPRSNKSKPDQAAEIPPGHHLVTYKVNPGETLSAIADVFHVSIANLQHWNGIRDSRQLKAGQSLRIYVKDKPATAGQTRTSAPPSADQLTHTVLAGETLYAISRQLGVSVNDLCLWNGIDPARPVIKPGDKLIYAAPGKTQQNRAPAAPRSATATTRYKVSPGDNLYTIARMYNTTVDNLIQANNLDKNALLQAGQILSIPAGAENAAPAASAPGKSVVRYVVKSGDNLWSIARHFGCSVASITAANDIGSNTPIKPGDTLKIITGN